MNTTQPNTTLYINNLNDKVNKEELQHQLFALFTTYGKIIDVVAQKGPKMRGQAFLVFGDLAGATAAMRACEGMVFYDKPMRIHYAKSKSYATLRREDPSFVPPSAAVVHNPGVAEKRARDEDMNLDERASKKEKADDDDGEEMEIDDDEEGAQSKQGVPPAASLPSARLLCTNLPQEVTDDVLSVLFQQYQGFQSAHVVPAPQPNADGQQVKMAQVLFDSPELSSVAKEALNGFTLKKGWVMSVTYV
ncbi:RNA-binding domain-containing protein [Heliocybe sulcata]|uniref:RNA-binding domain-containing protein n=1 Tax=Heliocybe sulcata TaxID=5364 RepID=A0A5C3NP94_9AGAM|nr:RNA-binding domain-containing protein [Heliocybe sulcata]